MRKTTGVLIIICLVAVLFSFDLQGQVQKFRIKVVTEQANIRVKPDIASEMLFQVPEGTELEAVRKEGEWFLVEFEKADGTKGRGYVHESLVEVISSEKLPAVKPAVSVQPEKPVPLKKEEPFPPEKKPEPAAKTVSERLLLSVYGGGSYVSASDLNQAAKGVTKYYLYTLGYGGGEDVKAVHLSFTYGLDVFYELYSGLFLGLGFDYVQGEKTNQTNFRVGTSSYSVITQPGFKDLPLRVSLMYQPTENFYLRIGVEYHLAKVSYLYRVSEDNTWLEWQGKASGNSLGWVEAAGLQWSATSWFQLFFEGSYRYARVKNFHGKNIYSDSDGLEQTEEGDLYYWQVQVSPSISFPALFIRDRMPSELGVINPRKADINYSGFSLKAGLRLRF
jgi:hypothetical protein